MESSLLFNMWLDRRDDGSEPEKTSHWGSSFRAIALMVLLFGLAGIATYIYAKRSFTESAQGELEAVAILKATEIERRVVAQRKDVRAAIEAPLFVAELRHWLASDMRDAAGRARLLEHLRGTARSGHYRDVSLRAAASGKLLLSTARRTDTAHERAKTAAVAKGMEPMLDDSAFLTAGGGLLLYYPVTLESSVPFVVAIEAERSAIVPADWTLWPRSKAYKEVLLLAAHGRELIYLNDPGYREGFVSRSPLPANSGALAAQALRQKTGLLSGPDYRGVSSLGHAAPVRGTNWIVVAKMDTAHAYSLLTTVALIRILTILAALAVATWVLLRYSRNTEIYYRHHFELKLLAKRLELLARHANDAMILSDLGGKILETNERALHCYGYVRQEMLRMNVGELVPSHSAEDTAALVAELGAGHLGTYERETVHRRKQGDFFPAEISVRLVNIGNKRYLLWIVTDITERKRMEQSLKSSEERFRKAFNHAPIAMAMVSLDGRLLSGNAATARLSGYSPDELCNLNCRDLFYPASGQQHADLVSLLKSCAEGYAVIDTRTKSRDGRVLDLSLHLTLIRDDDAHPLYILYQALDLTESKQAAARIQRLSALRAALSDTSQAILHSATLEQVFQAVCGACAQHMKVTVAWIGIADLEAQQIKPVNATGLCEGCVKDMMISTRADVPEGQVPGAVAYRENRVVQWDDLNLLPAAWQICCSAAEPSSAISLPILRGGNSYGTLNVFFGPDHGGYDDEEMGLLKAMADSISFAIDHFDRAAERRKAEEALRASEEKFRTLVDNLPVSVFVKDVDLRFVSCNASYANQVGIRPDQIAGKTAADFYPAALAERYDRDNRHVMAVGKGREFGEQTTEGDEQRYYHTVRVPIRNESGQISGVLGAFWDVTETKRAEMALRRYAAEVEDLYQNAPCGYHSMLADGTLTRINDTELRWLGYSRDEVLGTKKIHDFLLPASRHALNMSFADFMTIHEMELEMVRKDGSLLPVILNATAVHDADGNHVSTRATIHDISERKKLEYEQLRYTRHLKKVSKRLIAVQEEERRRLAAELHDRASPNLAAIKITLASLEGALPPTAQPHVEHLLSDAMALLDDTTQGIREICADLRPVLLDYSGLVAALEGYAAQFTKRTAIAVRVNAPRNGKVRLGKHKESALFRIVQEALTNCAKHAHAQTIDIELAKIDGQVTLTIKDDGDGFAATQPDTTPGLGLITMKERTEFMGGKLSLTSSPEAGTEIKVTLGNPRLRGPSRKEASEQNREETPSLLQELV